MEKKDECERDELRAKLEKAEAALAVFAERANWGVHTLMDLGAVVESWFERDEPWLFAAEALAAIRGESSASPEDLCEDQPGEWTEDCEGCSQCTESGEA